MPTSKGNFHSLARQPQQFPQAARWASCYLIQEVIYEQTQAEDDGEES